MVWRENLAVDKKEQNLQNWKTMPTKIGLHAFYINLYLHELIEPILFFIPWTIIHVLKGNFGHFESKRKGAKSPKAKRPHSPKLVQIYFKSASTCMKFMNWPPWTKGNFGCFEGKWKGGEISETGEATPTKIDSHAFPVNLYLHEFFWADSIFWPPWTLVHHPKGSFGHFDDKCKGWKFPKPCRESIPTKITHIHRSIWYYFNLYYNSDL